MYNFLYFIFTVIPFNTLRVLSLTFADEAGKPSLKVLTKMMKMKDGLIICYVEEKKAIFCEGHNIKQKLEWISPSGESVGREYSNRRIFADHHGNQTELLGLFFKKLTIQDGGNWTCRSGDELSQTVTLYVAEKININIKEVTVVGDEGKSIKLICDAKGFPKPVIQWYRGNYIIDDPNKYIIKDHKEHTLEIINLSHMDPGIYTCRATQEKISHFDQKHFQLHVRHKPIINYNDNEYTKTRVYAIMNEIKNITCRAKAYPMPKFSWAKRSKDSRFDHLNEDDQVFTAEDDTYSVLMLKVYKEDDLGQYKCSVENDRGRVHIIFNVVLGNKPDPPTSIKTVNTKAFNITFDVTCETCIFNVEEEVETDPKNLTVLGYNFQLVPYQEGIAVPNWEHAIEFVFDVHNATETLFTVSPLVNGTAYHARVATRNAAGLSDWLPVHPNPKTLEKNDVATLPVSLTLLIVAFFTTRCY